MIILELIVQKEECGSVNTPNIYHSIKCFESQTLLDDNKAVLHKMTCSTADVKQNHTRILENKENKKKL